MRFTKMHGTGNDFIIVEARGEERDWPALAVKMCDRHFGIGADGLILALPSQVADLRMRIINPDGSEAEMCGNGIRCLAKYAVENALARPKNGTLAIDTLSGVRELGITTRDGVVRGVRVGMGAPIFAPEEIPVSVPGNPETIVDHLLMLGERQLAVTCLSMGNPHAAAFLEEPVESFPLTTLGPLAERHPLFPRRVNFEIANVLDRGHIRMRVWERGAGLTLACGTGACAVAVAARLHGYVDGEVDVTLPGGTLSIEWDGAGEVFLTGPAATVFEGHWAKILQK